MTSGTSISCRQVFVCRRYFASLVQLLCEVTSQSGRSDLTLSYSASDWLVSFWCHQIVVRCFGRDTQKEKNGKFKKKLTSLGMRWKYLLICGSKLHLSLLSSSFSSYGSQCQSHSNIIEMFRFQAASSGSSFSMAAAMLILVLPCDTGLHSDKLLLFSNNNNNNEELS